jgi:DNA-binding transcriptional LysR family regulator
MTTTPAGTIRIGTVEYLNTVPLIAGLEHTGGVSLVPAVPSRIIDLLLSGEVDLGLVSLVDILTAPEPLTILPAGMIGCDGPTMTVRVFSGVPLAQISTLHADTDSIPRSPSRGCCSIGCTACVRRSRISTPGSGRWTGPTPRNRCC